MAKELTRSDRCRQFALYNFVEAMTWRRKKDEKVNPVGCLLSNGVNPEKGGMKIYHGFEGPWVIEIGRMVV